MLDNILVMATSIQCYLQLTPFASAIHSCILSDLFNANLSEIMSPGTFSIRQFFEMTSWNIRDSEEASRCLVIN
jgi:hypothetical protein